MQKVLPKIINGTVSKDYLEGESEWQYYTIQAYYVRDLYHDTERTMIDWKSIIYGDYEVILRDTINFFNKFNSDYTELPILGITVISTNSYFLKVEILNENNEPVIEIISNKFINYEDGH